MRLEEVQKLFANQEVMDLYGCSEGNRDFGLILSTSLGCAPGTKVKLKGGQEVAFVQIHYLNDGWENKSSAVFRIEDTYFSVTGDANSWDGTPDYTTPGNIKLVRPTEKMITIFEELQDTDSGEAEDDSWEDESSW